MILILSHIKSSYKCLPYNTKLLLEYTTSPYWGLFFYQAIKFAYEQEEQWSFRPRTEDYFFISLMVIMLNFQIMDFRPRTGDYFFIKFDENC